MIISPPFYEFSFLRFKAECIDFTFMQFPQNECIMVDILGGHITLEENICKYQSIPICYFLKITVIIESLTYPNNLSGAFIKE